MIAYLITNNINGKRYIGITASENPCRRWKQHVRLASGGSEWLLHKAIRKHGVSAFSFDVLASAGGWEDLCRVEAILIIQYSSFWHDGHGYNMTRGGDGQIGIIRSAKTRAIMSEQRKGRPRSLESRAKQSVTNKGKPHTKEWNAKIAASHVGIRHTAESKAKMSASRRGVPRGPRRGAAVPGQISLPI